ncbi:MAG: NAD(P)/FAD-dependent oxidoreductase [Actinomycetota bacterium]
MIGHDPARTYRAAVIGSGSGGLTAAIGLAGLGHESVLIEAADVVGGDCTNVGCIPSKALLHAAATADPQPLSTTRRLRDHLADEETVEMREHPSIHFVQGWARLTDRREPHVILVDTADGEVEVRAEHVVIATGSSPVEFPIEGLDPDRIVTNETLFEAQDVPRHIVLVGGGAISLEMATAFGDLGAAVSIVELQDRLAVNEDPVVSATIRAALEDRGVAVHTGTSIERFDGTTAVLGDGSTIADVDRVVLAIGRRPNTSGLGLDDAGVEHGTRGIVADDWGRTSVDGVWAVGDVTGNTLTTHGANAVGRKVVRGIGLPYLPKVGSLGAMANAIYSRPEIASVGLSLDEIEAMSPTRRRRYEFRFADTDRGFTDQIEHGVVVVEAERFTGRILRASIVGPAAAEMIGIFTLAIDNGIGLRKMYGMVHPYPSYAMAIGKIVDSFALDTFTALPREWWAMTRGRLRDRLRR